MARRSPKKDDVTDNLGIRDQHDEDFRPEYAYVWETPGYLCSFKNSPDT